MWQKLIEICEAIGTARAAHVLATQGHYELARKLVLENTKKEVK